MTSVRWYFTTVLICISLIISDAEQLFIYSLAICMPFLEKRLFRSSTYGFIGLFVCCLILSYMSCLYSYILETRIRWLYGIIISTDMSMSKLRETVKDREDWHVPSPWGHKELGSQRAGLNSKEPSQLLHLQTFPPILRIVFCLCLWFPLLRKSF